ncbi:phenylalanine--tRNA ligase subunit beta [Glacieibacterium megasporae]|uniref:phenylalanine--tRNA ligase subunit beta n=1 Tax=Glacieibacterium megasporae TaxID=2835787 RepID=UPI001C1DD00C|nr:phenylalanine--tRNA ligase subunit beta [Polymorphobacter megasporae]UAJ10303.1 phenylalanine--tRNA ligase subunit beta [Polymorphobacter megasporae]
MKFTLSWLRDHLDTDASLDRILTALTDCGLEVEGVTDPAKALAPFVIAEVLTAAPHPQADKLQVLTVTTGGDSVQVVCGAPNARAGMKGVFGAVGTYVPGSDLTLKVASIRGVESRGMMCSMRELELSDEHDGIIDLPEDAPIGTAYAAWAALDDPVIEVGITPNRQDCMGVAGIARDLAAAGIGTLRTPPVAPVAGCFPCPVEIRTDDPDSCPAFLGRAVRGVVNGPSPDWLQRRLRAIGQKPISALVDITNFITFDRGRPLHVYDLAHVTGGLTARRAVPGESVAALNGKTYALDATMTVIADDREVHDIGGIMGGAASGVSAATTDVLIECAYFAPERIGATGRKLGLSSDARARFERGVDPGFLVGGLDLATAMVLDLCGGEASDAVVAGSIPVPDKTVMYRPDRTRTLAGVAVGTDEQAAILTRLGFGVTRGERWRIAVPSWRRDIDGEADIVEEVVRINGFAHIPSTPLPRAEGVARPTATPAQLIERRLSRALAARGLDEAVTWSFVSPAQAEPFGGAAWTLDNPISSELSAMRPSLVPGLLAAAKRNLDRGEAGVRLFEVGRRYLADGEHATAAIVMAGAARARDWRTGAATTYSAFDAKAEAVAALAAAGVPVDRLSVLPPVDPWFHPGRSGRLALGAKMVLASFGELHPRVATTREPVAVAEIYLDAIPAARSGKRSRPAFTPPPLQAITRDFAFVVAADLPAETLLRSVRGADKVAITNVALFDRFPLDDKVSLALTVTLQPVERSFTDADIDAISAKIVAAAAKVGGVLRG